MQVTGRDIVCLENRFAWGWVASALSKGNGFRSIFTSRAMMGMGTNIALGQGSGLHPLAATAIPHDPVPGQYTQHVNPFTGNISQGFHQVEHAATFSQDFFTRFTKFHDRLVHGCIGGQRLKMEFRISSREP